MIRQCAWCLRQINSMGEPLSSKPLPKNYEATHGMCRECAIQWLEAVLRNPCWIENEEPETALDVHYDYRSLCAGDRIEV